MLWGADGDGGSELSAPFFSVRGKEKEGESDKILHSSPFILHFLCIFANEISIKKPKIVL